MNVELFLPQGGIKLEEEKKRKFRGRQQAKILQKENFRKELEKAKSGWNLIKIYFPIGSKIRAQFNLLRTLSVIIMTSIQMKFDIYDL